MREKPPQAPAKQVKLPIVYEQAIKDLIACQTLDEAKYFADKAEALAAWAKIYKSDEAAVEARRLRLHAYKRMGELALELRPMSVIKSHRGYKGGSAPGYRKLLMDNGLSDDHARSAGVLARLSANEFGNLVNQPRPPSLHRVRETYYLCSEAWTDISQRSSLQNVRSFCRSRNAKTLAAALTSDEAKKAGLLIREIADWLDEFEQYLPRANP